MQVDVGLRNAGDFRGAEPRFLGALIADPDIHAIVGDEHRGVARFHACARQERSGVGGLDDLRGTREAGLDVPLIGPHLPRLVERREQRVAHVRGVERGVRRRHVPLDRHLVDGRLRLIPVVGHDGDAAAEDAAAGEGRIGDREPDRGTYSRHPADRVEVVALDVAAVDRARPDRRPLHAGEPDVDPVDEFTGDLQRHVEVFLLGAHQRPLIRRLDGDRFRVWMRRLGRKLRDPAVGRRPPGPRVRDHAVFSGQLGRRDVPLGRGRQQQPLTRFGSGQLQVIAAILHGRGRVRPHAPVQAVGNARYAGAIAIAEGRHAAALRIGGAVAWYLQRPRRGHLPGVAVRGGVLRAHLAPVALQLLADHHRVGRPDALAKLGLPDADDDRVVGRDDNPRVDLRRRRIFVPERAGRACRLRARPGRHPEAEHERAVSRGDGGEKLSTIDVGRHARARISLAAR